MLKTALIVDDDHLEREYLTELLVRSGFVVRAEASVPNATALTKEMRFDCIMIDDRMPGAGGAEALREIRRVMKDRELRTVRTVLMGDARDESATVYRAAGFDHFFEKPVDIGILRSVLGDDGTGSTPDKKAQKAAKVPEAAAKEGADSAPEGGVDLGDGVILRTDLGLKNCGSEDNYVSAMRIFHDSIEKKAGEIEGYYNDEDWKDYTIKVHALKSSARIIGATALSEAAAALEDAGNREDLQAIREGTAPLLADYRALYDKLGSYMNGGAGEQDSRPAADDAVIKDALTSIADFADQMEYDLIEMVLASMDEYSLKEAERERFYRIRKALVTLDWDEIKREVNEG